MAQKIPVPNYRAQGSGRDTYVNGNFGPEIFNVAPSKTTYLGKNVFAQKNSHWNTSVKTPFAHQKNPFSNYNSSKSNKQTHYRSDGQGRDQYIISNNGGLYNSYTDNQTRKHFISKLRTQDNFYPQNTTRGSNFGSTVQSFRKSSQHFHDQQTLIQKLNATSTLETKYKNLNNVKKVPVDITFLADSKTRSQTLQNNSSNSQFSSNKSPIYSKQATQQYKFTQENISQNQKQKQNQKNKNSQKQSQSLEKTSPSQYKTLMYNQNYTTESYLNQFRPYAPRKTSLQQFTNNYNNLVKTQELHELQKQNQLNFQKKTLQIQKTTENFNDNNNNFNCNNKFSRARAQSSNLQLQNNCNFSNKSKQTYPYGFQTLFVNTKNKQIKYKTIEEAQKASDHQ
ncbi:hypothetical protein PPERSA_10406 [Pseudocohnilembus persalinus]|uniref:Uncharacterized protein n=1 Tax=Pseudocohnilembus persalinus TaxID=266149 RepID=A0A0V0QWH9_PSEPJ|nr:hypothetical protein PPERSA_10406 [Pseudocohnilembus persalinus]|eukprot:KRX06548.1 hypothetical protein PPERSA_10406 [Pseudocohnilembus persalinus]